MMPSRVELVLGFMFGLALSFLVDRWCDRRGVRRPYRVLVEWRADRRHRRRMERLREQLHKVPPGTFEREWNQVRDEFDRPNR